LAVEGGSHLSTVNSQRSTVNGQQSTVNGFVHFITWCPFFSLPPTADCRPFDNSLYY